MREDTMHLINYNHTTYHIQLQNIPEFGSFGNYSYLCNAK